MMRYPWHVSAVLLFVTVFLSTPAYPIAFADLTLSWEVWQESDSNQQPDSGETFSTSGIFGTWQMNGGYYEWCCDDIGTQIPLNPAEPGTGYTQDPWGGAIAGTSENYGQTEGFGTSSGSLAYGSSGSSLSMSSSAEMTNVQSYDRHNTIGLTADTSFTIDTGILFPTGVVENWTADDDPIYMNLVLDYMLSSPTAWALDEELRGAGMYVALSHFGRKNRNTYFNLMTSERIFDSSNSGVPTSGAGVMLLDAFQLNPVQTGDEWNYAAWTVSASAGASAAYYQNCPDEPPGPAAAIPEPSTLFLLGAGLIGVIGLSRKRRS